MAGENDTDPLGILTPSKAQKGDPLGILVEKKSSSQPDFTHGYKPTQQDVKQKQSFADLENGFDKSQSGMQDSPGFRKIDGSEIHTTKDYQPVSEKQVKQAAADYHPGSWNNTLGHVQHALVQSVTKTLSSGAKLIRDKTPVGNLPLYDKKGDLSKYGKDINGSFDPLGKFITTLDAANNAEDADDKTHPLPHTFLGNTATGVINIAPDIAISSLIPEEKLAEGAGALARLKSAIVNPFSKYMAAKGGLQGYSQAEQHGATPQQAVSEGVKGALKEGSQAASFTMLGGIGGKLSEDAFKSLDKSGLVKNAALTKAGLDASIDAALFSVYPAASKLMQGKKIDWDEVQQGFGTGLLFGGVKGLKTIGEYNEASDKIKQVVGDRQAIAMQNFMNADMDGIKDAHNMPSHAADINAKAVEYAHQAIGENDIDKKNELVTAASTLAKTSDVKATTEAILSDPKSFIKSIDESDLKPDEKQAMIDKVNQTYKELDPIEQQKTAIGKQITDLDQQIGSEKSDDPIANAENEVKQEQRKELNNKLKQLIQQQNEKENEQNDVAERPAVSGKSNGETSQNEEVNAERNRQEDGDKEKDGYVKLAGGDEPPVDEKEEENDKDTIAGSKEVGDNAATGDIDKYSVTPQTGIKKAISEATRIEKNLPEVKLTKLGKDNEVLQSGKKAVDEGTIKPAEVAKRVVDEQGIYTPDEAAAMQYYGHQLAQHEATLRTAIEATDDPDDKAVLQSNLQQLNDQIDAKTQADRINSRSWSNLGNTMQIEADHNFSPANIRSIIRENYGGKIPKEVEGRISKAEVERDKAIADLKKATEANIKKEGEKTVEKIRKSIKLVKQSKAELEEEASQLKTELLRAFKKDISRVNSGIPLPTETLAVLGKLAVNYFKQGIKDFEGLANKLYDDLKETGVKKDDIREYLSNYEPLRDEAKAKETERLDTKERSINKQLETGKIRDYSRKPKIVFKKDNDIIKAEQRVADAEYTLKQEKAKSYKADEGKYQRALNWTIRWERRSVLASPMILEKLASAATIGAAVNRMPKQLIGGAYSAIFRGLADKAPIEGGLNMDAELKFWKEFGNIKNFAKASKEILKTGASPLTKRFGEQHHEHYAGYDALMDLHAIIKDPPKRATFEASLKYAYEWAAKNDLDYNDPLIKRSLELAAYKRAEYEIFQENSGIAKRVNDFINSERKRTNVEATKKFLYRFLIPISTVPLNIARRIGSSIVGLPHGLYLTREAYKAGIDNLSNEQADYILRQVKNGSTGLAYFSLGMFASSAIMGGLWNKDDKKGKTDKPNQAGYDEMKPFGVPIDKRIQHAQPLFLMQLGATTARVFNHYLDVPTDDPKYQTMLKSGIKAMAATTGAVVDEIPMISEPVQGVEALSDPYEREKFGNDLKRRVGFSIAQDLGITSKDTTTPLDKKLKTVTNDEGEKVELTTAQLKQRKDIFAKVIKDNKQDWTEAFDDDWNNDKNEKARTKLSTYWHGIGRSGDYIKNKFADMRAEKLDQYIEKQAVEESEQELDVNPPSKVVKNTYSIK